MKKYGPDSLHSWFIVIYCSLLSMLLYGVVRLSGVLFVTSMSRFQVDRQQASLPYILCDGLQAMAGPLTGFLSLKFGTRPVVTLGSLIAAAGTGTCFFAESIGAVTVLWGIVYGFGFGLSSLLLPVIVTQHFLTRRATAIGIVYFGSYVGFSILPTITDLLIRNYGLSGTFLWLSGFLLHCVPLSMLLSEPKFDALEIPETANLRDHRVSIINGRRASFLMESKGTSDFQIRHNSTNNECKSGNSVRGTLKKGCKDVIPITFRKFSENWLENNSKEGTMDEGYSTIFNNNNVSGLQIKDSRKELQNASSNPSPVKQNHALVPENIPDPEHPLNTQVRWNLEKEQHCFHSGDTAGRNAIKHKLVERNGPDREVMTNHNLMLTSTTSLEEKNEFWKSGDIRRSNVVPLKWKSLEKEDSCYKRQFNQNLPADMHCKRVCAPNGKLKPTKPNYFTKVFSSKGVGRLLKGSKAVYQVSIISRKNNGLMDNLPSCMDNRKDFTVYDSSITNDPPTLQIQDSVNPALSQQKGITSGAFKIFLEPIFLLVLFSTAMFAISFIAFITVIVDFTKDVGLQESDGKYVIMAFSVASNVGLLSFGWVTDGGFMSLTNFAGLLFLVRTITLGLVPYSNGFSVLVGIVSVHGFFEASLANVFPLIVADYYTEEIHELAISCSLFMCGPAYLATPSLIGYFRDGLGSYQYFFLLMAFMSLTCSIFMFVAPILARCRCGRNNWVLRKRNT